jgi:hypothetical protein
MPLAIWIFAPTAACILLLFTLLLAMRSNNRLMAVQRQQTEEFAWLRRAITELQRPPLGTPGDGQVSELPRIDASEHILLVGDHVGIVDGLHKGEYGTIVAPPDWLPEGVVSVELVGRRGPRHVEASKLVRLNEPGRE